MRFTTLTLSAAVFAAACTPFNMSPPNEINKMFSYIGPDTVTDVSKTNLGGTVIYDEVIPFALSYQPPGGGPKVVSSQGSFQSRVVRSDKTGNYIFSYRFRDLTFNPSAPRQGGAQFIEIVGLNGYEIKLLPIQHYNISTSQSLGGETWGGASVMDNGDGTISFEWNSSFNKPDGTTFTSFETTARKFKTGQYISLGDQAFGKGNIDKVAVPTQ